MSHSYSLLTYLSISILSSDIHNTFWAPPCLFLTLTVLPLPTLTPFYPPIQSNSSSARSGQDFLYSLNRCTDRVPPHKILLSSHFSGIPTSYGVTHFLSSPRPHLSRFPSNPPLPQRVLPTRASGNVLELRRLTTLVYYLSNPSPCYTGITKFSWLYRKFSLV